MIKYKLNDQRVRRGEEIVELGELGGVVVSWWLRWSGDIFGCDERKVFLGEDANDHGFWNLLWGISKGRGGVAEFMELWVASLQVWPRSVRLWVRLGYGSVTWLHN